MGVQRFTAALFATFLVACAGPAPRPHPEPAPAPADANAAASDGGVSAAETPDAGPALPPESEAAADEADTQAGRPDGGVSSSQEPDRLQAPWSQTPTPPIDRGQVEKDEVAGGRHWRIGTEHGVLHVWRPPGYRFETAGLVFYVHGYFTNVDQAWVDHRLAEQFLGSGRNALFIAVEAPSWRTEDVFWKDLEELTEQVSHVTRLRVPKGPVVVVAHSGGFRTVQSWLTDEKLETLVMLDAMYGPVDPYDQWLQEGVRREAKRLLMVGVETEGHSLELVRKYPQLVRRKDLPKSHTGFTQRQREAHLLYMKAEGYDHMEVITKGEVLPLVLRLAPLKAAPLPRGATPRPPPAPAP